MSESPATGTASGYPGGSPDPDDTATIALDPAAQAPRPLGVPAKAVWAQRSRRALAIASRWTGRALAASGRGAVRAGATVRRDPLAWVQVAGGALVALGAVLPWISYSGNGASVSRNGFDYGADGLAMLVLGIVIAVLALMAALRVAVPGLAVSPATRLVFAGALVLVGVLAWVEVLSTGPEEFDIPLRLALARRMEIDSGAGIWLVLVGSVAAFLAALSPVLVPRLQRAAAR